MSTLGSTFWRFPGWPNPYWVTSNKNYLGFQHNIHTHKISEMLQPSATPISTPGLKNLGSYPFRVLPYSYRSSLSGARGQTGDTPATSAAAATNASGTITTPATPGGTPATTVPMPSAPQWVSTSGVPIASAPCGSSYGFTVPGYEGRQVYLVQTKNGSPQFSGLFSIPMTTYSSICNQDEGTYVANVYDPSTGVLIGSNTFTVTGTGVNPVAATAATTAAGTTAAGGFDLTSFISGITMTQWLMIGGVVVAIIYLKSRG